LLRRCAIRLGKLLRPRRLAIIGLLALVGGGVVLIAAHVWAAFHLSAARSEADRYHNATAYLHLQKCLSVMPRNPEALLLAARVTRRVGALELTEQYLARYEQVRGSDDDDLLLEQMLLRIEKGQADEVSRFWQTRLEQNHPTAPLILEALTRNCLRTFRLQDAQRALKQWRHLEPDDPQALLLQGVLNELRQQVLDARASYRAVLEIDPDQDDARLRLTGLLVQLHQAQEALPHLDYLRRRQPDNLLVLVRQARCQDLLGNQDEAVAILDGLLADHPDHVEALTERAKLALRGKGSTEAEALLRQALEREPSSYDARFLLHQCLARQGKKAEAQECKARLDELEKDLKRIDEILAHDMQRSPHNAALHYEAGMIALRTGAIAEGVRWLHSALREDPGHGPSHQALATYYQRIGNPALAARHREFARRAGALK
jgi:tetratricopeptide (TPR) repeat protein